MPRPDDPGQPGEPSGKREPKRRKERAAVPFRLLLMLSSGKSVHAEEDLTRDGAT